MTLKRTINKLHNIILCCTKHKKKDSLDIGRPTDVRRIDVSEALPGLTDTERRYIQEKASSDAIHLLGLQSHPPSQSAISSPSPSGSFSTSLGPASRLSSREPSEALLNAASKDLPSTLPTPPRQQHHESSPPAARMKGMREPERRSSSSGSSSSHTHTELFSKLEKVQGEQNTSAAERNESFMTLNLEFDCEDKKALPETPRTLSLTDGFETQSTIGGQSETASPVAMKTLEFEKSPTVQRAIRATALGDSSDSEEEIFTNAVENSRFVKI